MGLNSCQFMGRLTADPEMRQTGTGKNVAGFTIAIDRMGEGADFIPCTAWEKTADFIQKYFHKGAMIAVEGSMKSSSYTDRDGKKRSKLECVVARCHFTGEKAADRSEAPLMVPGVPTDGPAADDLPF